MARGFFNTGCAEIGQDFLAAPEEIQRAMQQALALMGAKAIVWSPDGSEISAKVSLNFWSWGEKLVVSLRGAGAVRVHSKCAFPLQLFDWGKNLKNCQAFLDGVERQLNGSRRYIPGSLVS